MRPVTAKGTPTSERLTRRFFTRRLLGVVLPCALMLVAAGPVARFGQPQVAIAAPAAATPAVESLGESAVRVLADSPAVALGVWSTVPVTLRLVPSQPGTVLYRWGSGPGGWSVAEDALIAPEGKQTLSYALVGPDGVVRAVESVLVRSDFRQSVPSAASSAGILTGARLNASGVVSVNATVLGGGGIDLRRLGGRSRYDTGVVISQTTFASASTVIIASGENFPDALTASGLAGALSAPVLLTQRKSLPAAVTGEIDRLGAGKAIICGGANAVDATVEAQLRALGLTVERIGGRNRYAVAAAVAQRIEQIAGARTRVFVARGDLYPDSLALAPAAYRSRTPILLVQPAAMPPETAAELGRGGYGSAFVAGGLNSVSGEVANQVASKVGPVTRWAGQSRYETAVIIAQNAAAFGNSWSYVGVATGAGFADALGGGVAAGERAGVILLTQPAALSAPTRTALQTKIADIGSIDVYGGTVAVSDATYAEIRALAQ